MARMEPPSRAGAWVPNDARGVQLQIEPSRELIWQSRALLERPVYKPMWVGSFYQRPSPAALAAATRQDRS